VLQLPDEPVSLLFVVLRSPVVVKIVQNFNSAIELVHKIAEHTSTAHGLDWVHESACQDVLQEIQAWVRYWNT